MITPLRNVFIALADLQIVCCCVRKKDAALVTCRQTHLGTLHVGATGLALIRVSLFVYVFPPTTRPSGSGSEIKRIARTKITGSKMQAHSHKHTLTYTRTGIPSPCPSPSWVFFVSHVRTHILCAFFSASLFPSPFIRDFKHDV